MSFRDRALAALYEAIEQENDILPVNKQLVKSPTTVLFGRNGNLRSLDLVSFLATLEQVAEEEFGVPVTLADERALSQKSSPFKSVETLADYLAQVAEEQTE